MKEYCVHPKTRYTSKGRAEAFNGIWENLGGSMEEKMGDGREKGKWEETT